jgi:hypothetical protein
MHTKKVFANRTGRRDAFGRGRFAVLSGVALVAPTFATDRIWNTDVGLWGTQTSWSPVGWPAVTDHVFIGSTPATIDAISNMDVGGTVAALDVVGRAQLNTQGRFLRVNGPARIDGNDSGGVIADYARLQVTNGASAIDFEADSLQIAAEGTLLLTGAPTVEVDGQVLIGADSRLVGSGQLTARALLSNGGQIQVTGGDMTINVTNGAWIDLDGGGNGEILVNEQGSALSIVASAVADAYDGNIALGGDSLLSMAVGGSWELGPASSVSVARFQSNSPAAAIQGTPLTIGGELEIAGSNNSLQVHSDTTIAPTANINVGTSNLLKLNGETTIAGGDFNLSPGSRMQFTDATTVEGGSFVLEDGANVDFDAVTTVSGGTFETFSNSVAGGSIDFNGDTTWAGSVTLNGVARQNGDAMVDDATTIDAGVFDMDGSGSTDWTVLDNLTVNASAINAAVPSNWFNGTLNIGSGFVGRLTVNLDHPAGYWTMLGEMNLTGTNMAGFPLQKLTGSPVQISGDLNVNYKVSITADTTLSSVSTTTLADATDELYFVGPSKIHANATFNGLGLIENVTGGTMTLMDGAGLSQIGLRNGGALAIGGPSGTAAVDRFECEADATWTVSVIGQSPALPHDLLIVSDGPTQLAGHLRVIHDDPSGAACRPNVGDQVTILNSLGAVSGTFAENPRSFSHGSRFDWTVVYGANSVALRLDQIGDCALGDIDDDGDVDLQDLAILLSNFGAASGAVWAEGDLDADGDVELQDLATLLAHFGSSCS